VPVYKHIDSVFNSRVHYSAGALLAELRVMKIILHLTFVIVDLYADGRTYNFCTPIVNYMSDSSCIVEAWPKHVPSETHSLEFYNLSRFIDKRGSLDMQTLYLRSRTGAREH
jgi:hypothetical protein